MPHNKLKRNVGLVDAAKSAADNLNQLLQEEKKLPHDTQNERDFVKVGQVRNEAAVLSPHSIRSQFRVVFFTQDVSVLEKDSPGHKRIVDLHSCFSEIHIVLLNNKSSKVTSPLIRFHDNVWLYATQSVSWWRLCYDAYRVVKQHLVFGGSLRADIIVAEDLLEAGFVAAFVSRQYNGPFQLHVRKDFFTGDNKASVWRHFLYKWSRQYILQRVNSVLATNRFQLEDVVRENGNISGHAELFPSYYDIKSWHTFAGVDNSLRDKYPNFKFTILHFVSPSDRTFLLKVFDSLSEILRKYPTVGLVVVGDESFRIEIEEHVVALDLSHKIKFETFSGDFLSYLRGANVLIHLSEEKSDDFLLIGAAAVQLPIVGINMGSVSSFFVNEQSAYLCNPGDSVCIVNGVNMFLNNNSARKQYALRAYESVSVHVEQDYGKYLNDLSSLIEMAVDAAEGKAQV